MSGQQMEDFEDFANKSAKMKYTEHEILYEKWKDEERQRRLDERKS